MRAVRRKHPSPGLRHLSDEDIREAIRSPANSSRTGLLWAELTARNERNRL